VMGTIPRVNEAILNRAPTPLARVNPDSPPELERIVNKTLEKERKLRYQNAADIRTDLQRLKRDTDSVRLPVAATVEVKTTKAKLWKVIVSAAIAAVALASGGYFYFHRAPKLTEKDTILLADFINTTGDPVFDGTLKQALAVQLQQSPFLSIFPDNRVHATLQLMGHSPDERVTGATARELCQRENIKAVLNGSISALGSQYVVSLDALNCSTGESLTRDQVTASGKENVLSALSQAATRLRGKLGESLSSIQKFDKPVQEVTTTSLDALKAYSQAWALNNLQAIPFYERAIQLDPNFAMAHSGLAMIYGNEGEEQRSIENMTKAYALRDRVSDRERFILDSNYHWMVSGDLDKEIANDELFHQTYPREEGPLNDLGIAYCLWRGQFEKGIQFGNEALRLNPHARGAYSAITCGYLGLNRPDEAKSILEPAIANDSESPYIRFPLFWVYAALGDEAGVERELQWASSRFAGAGTLSFASDHFANLGKMVRARQLSAASQELYRNNNFKESIAGTAAFLALSEAAVGNIPAVRQQVAASQALSHSRVNLPTAALALALAGDFTSAASLIADLRRRYPSDFQVNGVFGPSTEALVLASRGNTAAALQALQPAVPYELGPIFSFVPLYVRGLVYLRARQGNEAAAEFQKILDHRSLGASIPLYALSYVGLARSRALSGDTAKARTAYQDFFALWKDADPDIPILKQAKTEYAKLK